jgi:rRNA maturation endonuclease Nob1
MLWFACTALVVLAGFFVLMPLFKRSNDEADIRLPAETELDRLLDRKTVIYRNLKDLELEHQMGRLSDADFRKLEATYKSEAAAILHNLDQLNASKSLDEMIEKDIASRKSKLVSSEEKKASISRCPSCGAEALTGKKFCADCGRPLGKK